MLLFTSLLLVAYDDPRIIFRGRWDLSDPLSAAAAWPMSSFALTANGSSSVSANLTAPGDGARLLVRVDGVDHGYVEMAKGAPTRTYPLATGLNPQQPHQIEVFKVSEDNTFGKGPPGVLRLHSVQTDGTIVRPTHVAAAPRRLEFIGDSDTAGWCADGKPGGSDRPNRVEDAYVTWARQLAHKLQVVDGEVMVEAISGYGVTKHSGRLQDWYTSTLAFAPSAPRWNFSTWVPDAVVLLIGPNDESTAGTIKGMAPIERASVEGAEAGDAGEEMSRLVRSDDEMSNFVKSYLELCHVVASSYASAPTPPKLVHVCGGSINGLDPCDDIQKASTHFNKHWRSSATRSYYTSITTAHWHQINRGSGGYSGCDSHYGPRGHGVLAADIAPQLAQIMGWSVHD